MTEYTTVPYQIVFNREGKSYVYSFKQEPFNYDAYLIEKIQFDLPEKLLSSEKKQLLSNLGDFIITIGGTFIYSVPISFLAEFTSEEAYENDKICFRTNMKYFLDKMYVDQYQLWKIEIRPKIETNYEINGFGCCFLYCQEKRDEIFRNKFRYNYSQFQIKNIDGIGNLMEIPFDDCGMSCGYYLMGDIEDLENFKLITDNEVAIDLKQNFCQKISKNLLFIPIVQGCGYKNSDKWEKTINHNRIYNTTFSLGFSCEKKRNIMIISENLNILTRGAGFFTLIYG